MIKLTRLSKVCASCGIEKPLSAFIQFAGAGGTQYGNICSACRKTLHDKEQKVQGGEDSTTSREKLTLSLDAKAKAKIEEDLKQLHDELEDKNEEEREKTDAIDDEFQQKRAKVAEEERKHRDKKERSAIRFLSTTAPIKPAIDNSPAALAERENRYDTTNAFIDTYIPKLKYTGSAEFKKIQALFGPTAAISKLVDKTAKTAEKKETPSEKTSISQDIEKTWPSNHPTNTTRRR